MRRRQRPRRRRVQRRLHGGALLAVRGRASVRAPIERSLYAPSDGDDATYRASIAALTGGPVDFLDVVGAMPTAAQLAAYDCIYTWASVGYMDNVAFGDALADFVDAGGDVVLGAFTTYTQGSYLSGKIMSDGYSPVIPRPAAITWRRRRTPATGRRSSTRR